MPQFNLFMLLVALSPWTATGLGRFRGTDDCGEVSIYVAELFEKTDIFECDDLQDLTETLYDECQVEDEIMGLEGMRRIVNIAQDLDCDEDNGFEEGCEEAVACVEPLFDKYYTRLYCGDDEDELDDAIDCLEDIDDHCEFIDPWVDILESDEVEELCEKFEVLSKNRRRSSSRFKFSGSLFRGHGHGHGHGHSHEHKH